MGLLGKNIFETAFNFDIELRMGAGAFVCGEETALMASIEGLRGQPRPKPPFPAVKGLWGKPSVINNVETLATIRHILLNGWEWFSAIGTEKSKGTKVFALSGKVTNTGLVEVPMGITLGELVFDIGGGIPGGKAFKAAQTGGPSGGCIPAKYLNTPIDYESLKAAGLDHGLGRPDRPGRGQLHGQHGQVFPGVFARGIVRPVRSLPRRPEADVRPAGKDHQRQRHHGRPGKARKPGLHGARHVALRPGPGGAQPGHLDHQVFQARIPRTYPG